MNLDWEAIGVVGEVTGAIAVAVSLLYVAKEIRLNTTHWRQRSRMPVHEHGASGDRAQALIAPRPWVHPRHPRILL